MTPTLHRCLAKGLTWTVTVAAMLLAAGTGFAGPPSIDDVDGDGVANTFDNCLTWPNPDQRDSDDDGFGNSCDADLNNDGTVNALDLALFRNAFGTADPKADLNGDGVVNALDLALFRQLFGKAPGPIMATLGPSAVTVDGRRLVVMRRALDGTLLPAAPYEIRGMNWSPASRGTNTSPQDPNNATVRRIEFDAWRRVDVPLLKAMNVNTVRLFIDPGFDGARGRAGRVVLNDLYQNGIMVVMTVDDAINDMNRIRRAVEFYRGHPAVLMWSLGSEWNINRYFGVAPTVLDAAMKTQSAALLIKSLDDRHPVVSSYGDIGANLAEASRYVNDIVTAADVWSLNVYRGDNFGMLFQQWQSISAKPMFMGEFGIDAFHADVLTNPPPGRLDLAAQAGWNVSLWRDIRRNRSATNPSMVSLGGAVFEWNDEWWKVWPPFVQDPGGWFSGGFPDGMGNEEYFGVVDIDRQPRPGYAALREAFDPAFVPPPQPVVFAALSQGTTPDVTGCGYARFDKGATLLYRASGCSFNGGRGFNVAVFDRASGNPIGPIRAFDTYLANQITGEPWPSLAALLAGIPTGALVLVAIGDEAGLTLPPPRACTPRPILGRDQAVQALDALGSTLIRGYCYSGSWAMIAVKGEGRALVERLDNTLAVRVETTLGLP